MNVQHLGRTASAFAIIGLIAAHWLLVIGILKLIHGHSDGWIQVGGYPAIAGMNVATLWMERERKRRFMFRPSLWQSPNVSFPTIDDPASTGEAEA